MRRLLVGHLVGLGVAGVVVVALFSVAVVAWPEQVPGEVARAQEVPVDSDHGTDVGIERRRGARAPEPPREAVGAAAPRAGDLLLLWTHRGLPEGFARSVREVDEITAHTVVAGGLLEISAAQHRRTEAAGELDDSWVIPVDALAVDPASYVEVLGTDAEALADLDDNEVALGSTSADLRELESGDELTLAGGEPLTVAAVVDDEAVGAAEVIVNAQAGERLGVSTERFVLLRHDGDRSAIEQAVAEQLPEDTPVRVVAGDQASYLRHGDGVLPQALVKDRFGEFAYQQQADGHLVQDRTWRVNQLVTTDVPLLGRIQCHRAIVPDLEDALSALARRGLDTLVDPAGYGGCFNPRLTRSGDSVSRHAWGIAVDLNVPDNPFGSAGDQDPRLVEVFEEHGFVWGGEWLVPDPHHFERAGHR